MQQLYRSGLRPLLFNALKADPEVVHRKTIDTLAWLAAEPARGAMFHQPTRLAAQAAMAGLCELRDPRLTQSVWTL